MFYTTYKGITIFFLYPRIFVARGGGDL